MTVGSIVFIIGMVLFPLPVPLGLPVMVIGLAIMFKASNNIKRKLIRLLKKNPRSKNVVLIHPIRVLKLALLEG